MLLMYVLIWVVVLNNKSVFYPLSREYSSLFIHLGYPKTGTSFLQRSVFPCIEDDNPGVCILSNEGLVGDKFSVDVSDMEAVLKMLKRLYPDACIIIGVRDWDMKFQSSLYSQFVKQGGRLSCSDFFVDCVNPVRFDYGFYLRLLYKYFDEDSVFVYHFGEFKRYPGEVVRRLCVFMGVDVPENIDFGVRFNKAWSDRQVLLGVLFNRLFHFFRLRFWISRLGGYSR